MKILKQLLTLLMLYLTSWFVTVSLVYLIFMCFDLQFTMKIGTGIWLIFILLNIGLKFNNNKK